MDTIKIGVYKKTLGLARANEIGDKLGLSVWARAGLGCRAGPRANQRRSRPYRAPIPKPGISKNEDWYGRDPSIDFIDSPKI